MLNVLEPLSKTLGNNRVDDLDRAHHPPATPERWKDGEMVRRWAAAGMLAAAERSFRRIKGCKDMPGLVAALASHIQGEVTAALTA